MIEDQRVIIYPAYLNALKTVSQGRRLAKEKGCHNPTSPEIFDCVAQGLKLKAELEAKSYPRDFRFRGRVRVQLRQDDGSLANAEVPNKKALMIKIAQLVPRHPGRTGKATASSTTAPKPVQPLAGRKTGGKKKK